MNYRIFVEKKPQFRVEADSLLKELNSNLHLKLNSLRLLNVYDLFGFTPDLLEKTRMGVFGEMVTDFVYDTFSLEGLSYVAIESIPGQFDQRAASAVDCVKLLEPSAKVEIRCARLIVFEDKLTEDIISKIKKYTINAVECREKDMSRLAIPESAKAGDVEILAGFRDMTEEQLAPYCKANGLAMNADDLRCVVNYFKNEGRDPYHTELMILDTYWSDHCRHTTFTTELKDITIDTSFIAESINGSLKLYYDMRKEVNRENKPI